MTSNKIIASLAVAVATIVLATTTPPSSAFGWHRPHYHVHIVNELSRNEVLLVQCNCTDTARPASRVKVGTEYEWTFKEHAFRDTRWTCYVSPDKNRRVRFLAYEEEDTTPDYNRNVFWAVKEDGVYFRNPGGHDVLDYKWENGR
ncbi:S-protein homolog 8 [Linum grandiflorum]